MNSGKKASIHLIFDFLAANQIIGIAVQDFPIGE